MAGDVDHKIQPAPGNPPEHASGLSGPGATNGGPNHKGEAGYVAGRHWV